MFVCNVIVPLTEVGQITGTLVSVDEGLSLFLVLLYGAIIDRFGVRGVAGTLPSLCCSSYITDSMFVQFGDIRWSGSRS
jgi:hypothetical protein